MQRESLKEVAYRKIKKAIFNDELECDTIYSGQYFADRFNMSRTPVREALLQLEEENLIEIRPNRGIIIKKLDNKTLLDLSQMRSMIDGFCAAYLAENITSIDALLTIKKLKDIIGAQEAFLRENEDNTRETSEKWYALDADFHNTIVDYAGNKYIRDSIADIGDYITYIALVTAGIQDRKEESVEENRKIVEAIESGDSLAAFQSASHHAMKIFDVMIDNYAE